MKKMDKLPKSSSSCYCTNIRRASRALTHFYDESLAPSGLTVTRLGMLSQIKKLGKPGISELAEAFRVDRTTMNRNLKPMLTEGLIVIIAGQDARKKEVRLTELGAEKLAEAHELWLQTQHNLEAYLGEEELQQFKQTMAKIEALLP